MANITRPVPRRVNATPLMLLKVACLRAHEGTTSMAKLAEARVKLASGLGSMLRDMADLGMTDELGAAAIEMNAAGFAEEEIHGMMA